MKLEKSNNYNNTNENIISEIKEESKKSDKKVKQSTILTSIRSPSILIANMKSNKSKN